VQSEAGYPSVSANMKPQRFGWVVGMKACIWAMSAGCVVVTSPAEENVERSPQHEATPAGKIKKTKDKQLNNANAALKEKQSRNSRLRQSDAQGRNANSHRESRYEKADLITTGVGVVLSAIPKPTPQPASVAVKTTASEQKIHSHKRSHPKSSDDGLWSQINPISKDIPESRSSGIDNTKSETPPQ
jgi:hypothetical protein